MRLLLVHPSPADHAASAASRAALVGTVEARVAELVARGHDVVVVNPMLSSSPPGDGAERVAEEVRARLTEFPAEVVWVSGPEGGHVPDILPPGVGLMVTVAEVGGAAAPTFAAAAPPARRLWARLLDAAHHVVVGSAAAEQRLREAGVLAPDRPVTVVPSEAARWPTAARLEEELHLAHELARPKQLPRRSRLSGLYRAAWASVGAVGTRRPAPTRPSNPTRVAVVRLGHLGDQLLLDPLVSGLRDTYPEAALDVVVDDPAHVPPWMLRRRSVTYHTLHVRSGDGWARPGAGALKASLGALKRAWAAAQPGMIVFADPIDTDSIAYFAEAIVHLAPAAWRVGLTAGALPAGLLDRIVQVESSVAHETVRMAALAHAAGVASATPRLPTVPDARTARTAPRHVRIAIHMGASTPVRRWAGRRYAELAQRLHTDMDAEVVLVGSQAERDEVDLAFGEGASSYVIDRVGRTSLDELPALLRSCDAFVGNDSFPFHLAVACGLPSVVLIGPGAPRYYAYPLGDVTVVRHPLVCSPRHGEECPYMVTCPHAACMQAIRTDDVVRAVLRKLPGQPDRSRSS